MSPSLQAELAATQARLNALMAQAGAPALPGMVPAAAPAALGAPTWLQPPAALPAVQAPIGWSVVLEVKVQGPYGEGKATVDLCYGPETWNDAQQIVQGLIQAGYPVKVWVPKADNGFQKNRWGR